LHYGQYGGKTIKLLYSFFALASALLTITGVILFYKKRLLKKAHEIKKSIAVDKTV